MSIDPQFLLFALLILFYGIIAFIAGYFCGKFMERKRS